MEEEELYQVKGTNYFLIVKLSLLPISIPFDLKRA